MKFQRNIRIALISGLAILPTLHAEEQASQEIAGLQKAAADFVVAYNNKDAAALAKLFTEDGEITDLTGEDLTVGREQIQARYEAVFANKPLQIAIEVDSVRLVAPNLAIEDGTHHLTPADDETVPPKSTAYTAVLAKDESGEWRIASTRNLKDVTEAPGHLAALADVLMGEWTYRDPEGIRLDLAFGWDASGNFLIGEMLTTTADAEPQAGTIRLGWDAAKQQVTSWMFDAEGGFTHGFWIATDDGWLIRSEGTTAEGETLTANQQLTTEGADTIIWAASQRIVNGKELADKTLRLVRQAPEPSED
jgi:uncharacterized protein (TIGR02246 family)